MQDRPTDEPPEDWVAQALLLTGHFEDSANPWSGVTDSFDGMGVSLGVLQWNLGQGSLQPLVKAAGEAAVKAHMPAFGADFWKAVTAPARAWQQALAGWFTGTRLKPAVRAELKAFTGSDPFRAQQVTAAGAVARLSFRRATEWAAADPSFPQVSKRLFCWFFDVTTQNGSMKGLTVRDVETFKAAQADPVKTVCEWLRHAPRTLAGARDAPLNADLWETLAEADRRQLLVMSYLRAARANPRWAVDVMNRKGTIAAGRGWVHRAFHDLEAWLA
ncbi:MAG: hypothetical protein SNJ79_08490 [Sphingomonadaceae bacterium]